MFYTYAVGIDSRHRKGEIVYHYEKRQHYILIYTRTTAQFQIEDEEIPVKKGTLLLISPDKRASYTGVWEGYCDDWINFYDPDGSLVAENLTKIDDPGYPMDVAVSDNGVMMVTFQYVDGSKTTSYVAFYNYGDVGQNEDDRIVSGYTYEDVVIPQVECISDSKYIALRDDGFSTYQGSQIPKESKTVNVKQEIVSTFFSDDRIGLVFKNNNKDDLYTMEVYNMSGQLKFRKNFNIPYTTIKMSGDNIIMYNSSQICVMNSRGVQKYAGNVDGTIRDFFKIGWNKYLMVLDTGVSTIKFS